MWVRFAHLEDRAMAALEDRTTNMEGWHRAVRNPVLPKYMSYLSINLLELVDCRYYYLPKGYLSQS